MLKTATVVGPSLQEVGHLLVRALRLEDAGITEIQPSEALFGSGLGLDSIDALELVLAVSKEYGVTISSDNPNLQTILGSLENLTAYIQDQLNV